MDRMGKVAEDVGREHTITRECGGCDPGLFSLERSATPPLGRSGNMLVRVGVMKSAAKAAALPLQ